MCPKNKPDQKTKLNTEDQAEWDEFIREFGDEEILEEDFAVLLNSSDVKNEETKLVQSDQSEKRNLKEKTVIRETNQNPQLDKRTFEKLRKGKMKIEARLDLHGMSREIAHEAVLNFINASYKRGLRTVMIITGKGKGILKENVPYWLEDKKIKPNILKFVFAQLKDGGDGALYVYLKRKR